MCYSEQQIEQIWKIWENGRFAALEDHLLCISVLVFRQRQRELINITYGKYDFNDLTRLSSAGGTFWAD